MLALVGEGGLRCAAGEMGYTRLTGGMMGDLEIRPLSDVECREVTACLLSSC